MEVNSTRFLMVELPAGMAGGELNVQCDSSHKQIRGLPN